MIGFLRRPGAGMLLLGIAAYVAFLVVNLPAAWVGVALERSSGGKLALGDPGGTAWSGHGALALFSSGGYRRLVDLEWRMSPLALLAGRLSFALSGSAPDALVRGNVSFGLRGLALRDVDASAPAATFEHAIPALVLAKPDGRVRVQAIHLEAGRNSLRGVATLEWTGGGLPGLHTPRLGDYRLQITGNGDRADLRLATLRGDLRLTAQGEWRASQPNTLQMRGVAQFPPERKDLEALLPLLGIRGAGSSRPFLWTVPIG
ncbi:MAG: type II secretion system protein N [Burkholderiales bacterium]